MAKAVNTLLKIERQTKKFKKPLVSTKTTKNKPYQTLILCLLSLRTKDVITEVVGRRLFKIAPTPRDILKLTPSKLGKIIHPVGFYNNKAKNIIETTKTITSKHHGKVPEALDELLKLKGVGRKTANLVLGTCYGVATICVDTHVHRISNRLGLVKTKTPLETEMALRKLLPQKYWKIYNSRLVAHGQNVCSPISPKCSMCRLYDYCNRVGVKKSR